MTPKQKAIQLLRKMHVTQENAISNETNISYYCMAFDIARECALIAVDEIIDALEKYDELTEKHLKDEFDVTYFSCELQNMDSDFRYWEKVKQEIINI